MADYTKPRLVFVHLGTSPTRWLLPNVLDHFRRFNGNVTVVTDHIPLIRDLENRCVKTFFFQGVRRESETIRNETQMFRNGFWMHTFERFYALQTFQEHFPHGVLHLESDVVLSDACDLGSFLRANKPLQYPLLTENNGVGSVFFSSKSETIAHFNNHLRSYLNRVPNGTDMGALHEYARDFPERVGILPTLIPGLKNNLAPDSAHEMQALMSSGIDIYGGLFDGATIGQYLFGLDPRNQHGRVVLSHSPPDHVIDASQYQFQLLDDGIYISSTLSDVQYPLLNLHIHSKDLRAMQSNTRSKLAARRIRKAGGNSYSEFSWWGFVSWAKEMSQRRLRQILIKVSI